MLADHDPMEDLPFEEGVSMSDWTGMAWKEIPQERVKYLVHHRVNKNGNITAFLSEIPAGEGRKRDHILNLKMANSIRNSLYKAASRVWGPKTIKVSVTRDNKTGTYTLEFVHLASAENEA